MARYVVLVNWTEEGARTVQDTVKRTNSVAQLTEKLGARMTDIYWTLGEYDLVGIFDAPDDETMTAVALAVSSRGAARTQTLRAFERKEMESILQKAVGS